MAWTSCSRQKSVSRPEKRVDPDVAPGLARPAQHRHPLVGGEQPLLRGVDPDGDDDLVEECGGPPDDVEVPVGDGVERTGAHGTAHGFLRRVGVSPPRSRRRGTRRRDRTRAWSRRSAAPGRRRSPRGRSGGRAPRGALDGDQGAGHQPVVVAQRVQVRLDGVGAVGVGRVEEDQVVRRPRHAAQRGRDAAGHDVGTPEPDGAGVVADQSGGPAVLLDERDHAGAPRPRLDPDRAGAGVEVEEPEPAQRPAPGLDRGEQRLPDPVAGRAGVGAALRLQPAATRVAADDAGHARSRPEPRPTRDPRGVGGGRRRVAEVLMPSP